MSPKHGNFLYDVKAAMDHSAALDAATDGIGSPQNVFGRMFDEEKNQPSEDKLKALAKLMDEAGDTSNPDTGMPVGFVFMGQFIDHDLTLDTRTKLAERPENDKTMPNFRTPRLELDSVYLHGQAVSTFLYDRHYKMVFGTKANSRDLPRNSAGVAIIGDPRNDENLFVSQFHGLMLQLHNRYMDQITGGDEATGDHFNEARRRCRHLYQRIIVADYLPRIIHKDVLGPLLKGFWAGKLPGPADWDNAPDMPFEFSAAAFRFGHSQVRDNYQLNSTKPAELFELGGFGEVPGDSNLDWNYFFDFGDGLVQYARPIDTKLSNTLLNLPKRVAEDGPISLPERNLVRGQLTFGLPFGEDVANAWGFAPIPRHDMVKKAGLDKTPLWFYALAEAEAHGGKLGPVGGTIVAGVLLNAMLRDPSSIAGVGPDYAAVGVKELVGETTMAAVAKYVS